MTIKDLLAQYNDLARNAGVPALKVWKESRAKLETKVKALAKKTPTVDNVPDGSTPAGDDALVTVADVARELGMTPKAARARLRRSGATRVDGRWPSMARGSDEHNALVALLQPS